MYIHIREGPKYFPIQIDSNNISDDVNCMM